MLFLSAEPHEDYNSYHKNIRENNQIPYNSYKAVKQEPQHLRQQQQQHQNQHQHHQLQQQHQLPLPGSTPPNEYNLGNEDSDLNSKLDMKVERLLLLLLTLIVFQIRIMFLL